MDCSPPDFSIHRILQAQILDQGCHVLLQGIFPTQGSNPCLLRWQLDSWPQATKSQESCSQWPQTSHNVLGISLHFSFFICKTEYYFPASISQDMIVRWNWTVFHTPYDQEWDSVDDLVVTICIIRMTTNEDVRGRRKKIQPQIQT